MTADFFESGNGVTGTESYITVTGETSAEYSEKRSRFIAVLRYTPTEQAAADFIAEIRLKHRDARHNCFAYSVNGGKTERYSDDGEPHGTAGKPMLDIIKGAGITDVTVVVTRYFGGVLLGTGGLVRAYSAAAKQAVASAERVKMTSCTVYKSACPYSEYEHLSKLIESAGGTVDSTDYTDIVTLTYYLDDINTADYLLKLKETFAAKITAEETEKRTRPVKI